MPVDLDDFLIGDGGNRPPGKRYKVDDFLLSLPATPQEQPQGPVTVLPQAGQQPFNPRELLTAESEFGQSAQAAMIAAGETTDRALTSFADPRVKALVESERPSTEALREEFPKATMAGDVLPAMALPGGGIVGGAAAGALVSDDKLTGALFGAAGGVLGVLGSRVLMRSITPFPRGIGASLPRETKRLARNLGVKLELADTVSSRSLKNTTTALKRNPFASSPFDKIDDANQVAFNRAALDSVTIKGKTAPTLAKGTGRITDQTLESVRKTLSDGFERIGKSVKKVDVPDEFLDDLAGFLDESRLSLGADAFTVVERNVNKALDTVSRTTDGRALTSLSSTLGKRAVRLSKPGSATSDAGDALFDLKDIVDDLFEKNAGPTARKELGVLREKWRNLRVLRERNVIVDGNISPASVRSVLQTKHPDAWRLGGDADNKLFQMARLHESVRDLIPNSGTPTGQALTGGSVATAIPQREAAKLLNSPTFKFMAANNLLPEGLQRMLEKTAGRTGAVTAAQEFE